MPEHDSIDNAVENADVWALARNPVYRRMQQRLIERTAERDVLRYFVKLPISLPKFTSRTSITKGPHT